jgi:hypothetical protein
MINEIVILDYERLKITFDTNELCFKLYIDNILTDVKDDLKELFKVSENLK